MTRSRDVTSGRLTLVFPLNLAGDWTPQLYFLASQSTMTPLDTMISRDVMISVECAVHGPNITILINLCSMISRQLQSSETLGPLAKKKS